MLLVAVARNRQECVLNAIESQSLLEREREEKKTHIKSWSHDFFPSFRALKSFPLKKKMLRVDQLVSDKTRMLLLLDRHPSLISQRVPIHLCLSSEITLIYRQRRLSISPSGMSVRVYVTFIHIQLYVFTLCLASALVLLFAMSNAKKK